MLSVVFENTGDGSLCCSKRNRQRRTKRNVYLRRKVQNDKETVTRHYIVDYLSIANRDIFVAEDGSYTTRYVYDEGGKRISAEFDYAPGTKRGEAGENLQSDIAVSMGKVFYRTSILGSTLFAVDKNGNQIAHAVYDPWGKPLTETYTDSNYSATTRATHTT